MDDNSSLNSNNLQALVPPPKSCPNRGSLRFLTNQSKWENGTEWDLVSSETRILVIGQHSNTISIWKT